MDALQENKKALRDEIRKEKRIKWKELIGELENDVFGNAYKIVRTQMGINSPRISLTTEERLRIFHRLFVTDRDREESVGISRATSTEYQVPRGHRTRGGRGNPKDQDKEGAGTGRRQSGPS